LTEYHSLQFHEICHKQQQIRRINQPNLVGVAFIIQLILSNFITIYKQKIYPLYLFNFIILVTIIKVKKTFG